MNESKLDPRYTFATDDVLFHWHHMACMNAVAERHWERYIEEPF